MKKIFLSLVVIVSFGLYSYSLRHKSSTTVLIPTSSPTLELDVPPSLKSSSSAISPTDIPTPMSKPSGYKDGNYTSPVTDAFYGNVQIKVAINGGKVTDVQFLQYPNDREHSVEVNLRAMPQLRTEAIQTQKSQVDIISGATQTSIAFEQALEAVLQQAS